MTTHIYLAAVEDSADALGSDLAQALRSQQPDVRITGIGGDELRKQGVSSPLDLSGLAILGLVDGVLAFQRVKRIVRSIADEIQQQDPDVVVLIDSWGIMWRVARELKLRNLRAKRVKLIGPQVWATRPGRARVLARWCEHLLCIHDFEQAFYREVDLPTTVIGNPAIGRLPQGDRDAFRRRHDIAASAPIIGILPGSRTSELQRVAPTLAATAALLKANQPAAAIVCLPAPSIRPQIIQHTSSWQTKPIIPDADDNRADAMAAMDVALACSGTVTTELAEQGAAVITGYKLGWLSWAIARAFLLRTRFISLINIAAGREIMPEFVQTRLRSDLVVEAATSLLEDAEARQQQIRAQHEVVARLAGTGEGTSAQRAASAILKVAGSPVQAGSST